jgi:hypothetical protein
MWLARCWPGDDLLVLTILSRRSRRESIVLTLATCYCCPLDQPPPSRFLPPRSGLERSDFVRWPIGEVPVCFDKVRSLGHNGQVQSAPLDEANVLS